MTTATPSRPDFREQQADDAPKWWRDLSSFEQDILLIAMVVIIIGLVIYGLGDAFALVVDFVPNVITEILFFAATVVIIDHRNRERSENERKEELIMQMASPNNEFAVEAVRLLRHYGWLTDGTLAGADLRDANLQGANLTFAILDGVNLAGANLQGADLSHAEMEKAILWLAEMEETMLTYANLQGAVLREVKLDGANLWLAKLKGAFLLGGKCDEETILPDGSRCSDGAGLKKFTDPDHPDFWQPDWVKDE